MNKIFLGVNIDHIATLREARGTSYPDPVHAAGIAELNGADGITIHLREDRRHIQDRDVRVLKETIQTRMNLELAVTDEMLAIACDVKPEFVCLVPEKREELTTEGGLDVLNQLSKVTQAVTQLAASGIQVSLFIDANNAQIDAAVASGAPFIELHTGTYSDAKTEEEQVKQLAILAEAVNYAHNAGLKVNAGHGLHYHNVQAVAAIENIYELNIGHSIIARAAFDGLGSAVKEMQRIMQASRNNT